MGPMLGDHRVMWSLSDLNSIPSRGKRRVEF